MNVIARKVLPKPFVRHPLCMLASVVALTAAMPLLPARADDAPAMQAAQPAPMTAQSKISATIEFGIPALESALERHVPKVLANFDDRTTRCWHRRMFRREVDVDCVYSGMVERTGPISLRADNGRLVGAVPVYGRVAGQGIGRFARLLHGAGEGELTVYATARPRLRPDWSVALDMSEGFRWQEPPVLRILGFEINLSRYVEPRVRVQVERIQSEAAAYMRSLDLRDKAETAWRHAFTPVKIFDTPEIWLQMTPQTVAFAGTHAHGDVLEGAIEITGTTATFIGQAPPSPSPTPLPALGADVSAPGRFEVVIPVGIDYNAIRSKMQDAIAAMHDQGFALHDAKVYPSGDKIVFGLRLASSDANAGDGDWIYLTASPKLDADAHVLQFPDIKLDTGGASLPPVLADWFKDDAHLKALREQLRIGYQDQLNKIVASANNRLTRSLGNGYRSEAHLSSSGIGGVEPLDDGVRIDFRLNGDLKILYGL